MLALMRAFGFGVSGGAKRDATVKAGDGAGKFGRGRDDIGLDTRGEHIGRNRAVRHEACSKRATNRWKIGPKEA